MMLWRGGCLGYNTLMKEKLTELLTNPQSKYFFLTSDVLALCTVASVLLIVLETEPRLSSWSTWFVVLEWLFVLVFSAEYVARVWIANPKQNYVFSFYGVVDLVSVLPTIFGLGNLTFLKSARIVRILRLLRLIRLAKIRHLRVADLEHNGSVLFLNVSIYTMLLTIAVLLFAVVLHVFEPLHSPFSSMPVGMWWTFGVFTGDTPGSMPVGGAGEIIYVLGRFVGLLLLGALVGVSGNIMRHYLLERRG
jgi:voltage-gated potassium channel